MNTSSVGSGRVSEANIASVTTWKSSGSSMRCNHSVMLRKNVPNTMPTSSIRWIERRLPPNIHVNRITLKPTMTPTCSTHSVRLSAARKPVAPKANTIAVVIRP